MGIFDYCSKQKRAEISHRRIEAEASERYQLREYEGEIWLTFSGCLVCPCSMLKDAPVDAVKKMRELYIKRNEV